MEIFRKRMFGRLFLFTVKEEDEAIKTWFSTVTKKCKTKNVLKGIIMNRQSWKEDEEQKEEREKYITGNGRGECVTKGELTEVIRKLRNGKVLRDDKIINGMIISGK